MPRSTRLDAPGILHHVIVRGIERRDIFRDVLDQERFVDRLSNLILQTRTRCYEWVLMTASGVGYAVRRGEVIAQDLQYLLEGENS